MTRAAVFIHGIACLLAILATGSGTPFVQNVSASLSRSDFEAVARIQTQANRSFEQVRSSLFASPTTSESGQAAEINSPGRLSGELTARTKNSSVKNKVRTVETHRANWRSD